MGDVLIAGAGISRFGRTEHTTGRQHAVHAVRAALADAGIPWSRVGAAFGGSDAAGLADTLVAQLGLTGVPIRIVSRSAVSSTAAIRTRSGSST